MRLFFLIFCLFVLLFLVRPVCFFLFFCLLCFSFFEFFLFSSVLLWLCLFSLFFCTCYSPCPSCSSCPPASFHFCSPRSSCSFVLCFLSPRSLCSCRSPSPFRSQEVRRFWNISSLFRLATLVYCPRKADPGGRHPAAFEGCGLESGAQGRCAPGRPGLLFRGRRGCQTDEKDGHQRCDLAAVGWWRVGQLECLAIDIFDGRFAT